MAASTMETGEAKEKAKVPLHRTYKAVCTLLFGRWLSPQMNGMIRIFLSKIKCVEGEGSWRWKHSPAAQHRARKLSGTERTLEQNRAAPAQEFDSKGVVLSPWDKSLLFAHHHAFLCLLHMDELCSSLLYSDIGQFAT